MATLRITCYINGRERWTRPETIKYKVDLGNQFVDEMFQQAGDPGSYIEYVLYGDPNVIALEESNGIYKVVEKLTGLILYTNDNDMNNWQ